MNSPSLKHPISYELYTKVPPTIGQRIEAPGSQRINGSTKIYPNIVTSQIVDVQPINERTSLVRTLNGRYCMVYHEKVS